MNKPLHPVIYFVADKPSKRNQSQSVPLVGTPTYGNFLNWLHRMNIDCTRIRVFNQSDNPFPTASEYFMKDIKIVALGNQAKDYLLKSGLEEFYVLPHPSPLNRFCNNKRKLKQKLDQCRDYIYSEN